MNAAPEPVAARLDRALDRLHEHCLLVGRMTAEEQRSAARERLEEQLGPELTSLLLGALAAPAAA
jgi:hypothetical protein